MTPTRTRRHLHHDGRDRTWLEITAADGTADTLVMFLHGSLQSGSVARTFTGRTFDAFASRGCAVVYPDGVDHHFNDLRRSFNETARTLNVDDVGFLRELIALYGARRVIGCGFSNGGQMLLRMLVDAPGALHGVALFGAPAPTDDNMLRAPAGWVPTPILAVQGTADPIVPYEGGEAGIGPANRGTARSALDSARYLAFLNGSEQHERSRPTPTVTVDTWSGGAPVELWSLDGVGHLVPSPARLDERLGPGTDAVVGADLVSDYFSL
ncbi:alpha/beta hydrolase family esterase [Corynebacterium timonense]|uniref:Polyhydroxybutyrate depolymerase n=1 Tax=Corynebacterium timonense TaxID=441500 RepID=A0A1H1L7N8_9CORY|nr:hypothetical protein [Corynebacterium timonense]SDR70437.1 polyhydroxybutyrate depolymerase [Corynebacterium timonense]